MTIRERVTTALRHTALDDDIVDVVDAAITAFLEAAAEEGWHMRPDEATEEMAHEANGFSYVSEYTMRQDLALIDKYHAMQAVATEFEWDK